MCNLLYIFCRRLCSCSCKSICRCRDFNFAAWCFTFSYIAWAKKKYCNPSKQLRLSKNANKKIEELNVKFGSLLLWVLFFAEKWACYGPKIYAKVICITNVFLIHIQVLNNSIMMLHIFHSTFICLFSFCVSVCVCMVLLKMKETLCHWWFNLASIFLR